MSGVAGRDPGGAVAGVVRGTAPAVRRRAPHPGVFSQSDERWFTVAACALLVVASWRVQAIVPGPAGDFGWMFGLHQARTDGLRFGADVTFTYGPLAWLALPSSLSRLEVAAAVLVWFPLVLGYLLVVQAALRDLVAARWAWLATVGTAAALVPDASAMPGGVIVMAAVASLLYGTRALPARVRSVLPVVAGAIAGTLLLVKFSSGVIAGGCVAGAIVSLAERRVARLVAFAAGAATACLLLWMGSQGRPTDLAAYLAQSVEFAQGYAGAMGMEIGRQPEYLAAAVIAVGLAAALWRLRARASWLQLAVLVGIVWAVFKQGFVRHDSHSALFFCVTTALAAVLAAIQRSPPIGLLAVFSLVAQTAAIGSGLLALDPRTGLDRLGELVILAVDPGYQGDLNRAARLALRQRAALPPEILTAIDRRSVDVEPFDEHLAWAHGWTWRALPTIHGYAAYTPRLDALNVEALRDEARAPRTILREDSPITLDGRATLWDPPRTQLELLCRYRVVARAGGRQVLARSGNRCGAPQPLSSRRYGAREVVDVPAVENGIVVARITPHTGAGHRLGAMLFKPRDLTVQVDGRAWRLPWGHAGAPLVLSVAGADDVGFEGTPVRATRLRLRYPATIAFEVIPLTS